jgi:hypothetical protein
MPYTAPTPRACSRRDPRSEPGHLPRERDPLRPVPSMCRSSTTSCCRSARRASTSRQGRHDRLLRHRHDLCGQGRSRTARRSASTPRSSICARSARWTFDTVIASVKKTGRWSPSRKAIRRTPVGTEIATRVMQRPSTISMRRFDDRRQGRADALRRQPRKARASECRRSRRGGESRLRIANKGRRISDADQHHHACPVSEPWKRAISPNGWSRKAIRLSRATCSPRSRPTRRRWKSKPSTRASLPSSSFPPAPKASRSMH